MVDFTGYAKKPEPKWIYALIVFAGVLAMIALYGGLEVYYEYSENAQVAQNKEKPSHQTKGSSGNEGKRSATVSEIVALKWKPPEPMKIEDMVLTSGIGDNNLPIDQIDVVAKGGDERIYCYSRVQNVTGPRKIRYVWISPDGIVAAETRLEVDRNISNTWSYINIEEKDPGLWEVRILNEDGRLLARRNFRIEE